MMAISLKACAFLVCGFLAGPVASEVPREVAAIDKGVSELGAVGSPGGVTVFGDSAWPLVVGGDVTVAAAAEVGGARVIAMGQGGYAAAGCLTNEGTERFMLQSLRWLAGGKKKPVVGWLKSGMPDLAEGLGLKTTDEWQRADVILLTSDSLRPEKLEAVRAFLAGGGGALVAVTPWGWQQLTPKLKLARDLTLNRLLLEYGLAFDHRTASKTGSNSFLVAAPDALPAMLHADRAWAALAANDGMTAEERRLAQVTVGAAIGALDDYEPTLMLPMRRRLAEHRTGDFDKRLAGFFDGEAKRRELLPLGVRWGGWQVGGPFATAPLGRKGKELGGKLRIEDELKQCVAGGPGPDLGKAWKVRGGKLAWRAVELDKGGQALDVGDMDLGVVAGAALSAKEAAKAWQRGTAVCLYRTLDLEAPIALDLRATGDGGLALFVDGELVGTEFAGAGTANVEASVQLDAGAHHLFVKSVHTEGKWHLRLTAEEGFDQGRIDASVSKGVDWLVNKQLLDGSWAGDGGYGPGYTAMVLFALAKSGLSADHPVMRRGMAYLDAHPARHTYSLSAVMLARAELDPGAGAALAAGVKQLGEWIEPSGMWAYPIHPSGSKLDDDLSNTLFVGLALDAAAARGVLVDPELWRKMVAGTLSCLEHERAGATGKGPLGFSYRPRGNVTGSMTVAGLSCLLYAKRGLGESLTKREAARIDDAVERGLAWLDRNMVWDTNPGQANWILFWIYGIERLGSLLGTRELGGIDWYRSGAEHLLEIQGESGDWYGGHPGIDSVLSLLFLRRATAATSGAASARDWRLASSGAQSDAERPLEIQVRRPGMMGEKLEAWVQDVGEGAAVTAVTWVARVKGVESTLAVVDADADKGALRFAMRVTMDRRELADGFELFAKAALEGGGELRSEAVSIPALFSEEELGFAFQIEANLLQGATASATSSRSGSKPRDGLDGNCDSNWICEPADRDPVWSAELPSAKTASRLYLVHRGPALEYSGLSHVARAKVTLNRRFEFEVELGSDSMRPVLVDFGRNLDVNRIDIAILETSGPDAATGFSEVVLLP